MRPTGKAKAVRMEYLPEDRNRYMHCRVQRTYRATIASMRDGEAMAPKQTGTADMKRPDIHKEIPRKAAFGVLAAPETVPLLHPAIKSRIPPGNIRMEIVSLPSQQDRSMPAEAKHRDS